MNDKVQNFNSQYNSYNQFKSIIKIILMVLFLSRFPQLNFEYQDPQHNFDRSRVKGLVCNLFKIKDPKFATALEVAAGGRVVFFPYV